MTEHRRKGETEGRKLTPGERFNNWVDGMVKIWPILLALVGALGYTNKDHIRDWVGLAEADGKTEITESGEAFPQQVKRFSEEVRAELVSLRGEVQKVNARLAQKDAENYERLEGHLQQLKAQVAKIQELVN